jgi:hypothetical protein
MTRRHLLALPLLALLILVGCSSKTAGGKVSGKVTYNGAAVPGGVVAFYYESATYTGQINPDGTYEMVDIPAGDVVITVDTESLKPVKQQTYTGQTGGGGAKYGKGFTPSGGAKGKGQEISPAGEGSPQTAAGSYMQVPAKYRDRTQTPLKEKVGGGSQTINLQLTD